MALCNVMETNATPFMTLTMGWNLMWLVSRRCDSRSDNAANCHRIHMFATQWAQPELRRCVILPKVQTHMAKLTLARKGRCKIIVMHREKLQGETGKFKTQDFYKYFQQWRNYWTSMYHLAGELHKMHQQLYAVK